MDSCPTMAVNGKTTRVRITILCGMVKYNLVMCRQRLNGAIRGDHEQYIYIIRDRFASEKRRGAPYPTQLRTRAHKRVSRATAALLLVADTINRASMVI